LNKGLDLTPEKKGLQETTQGIIREEHEFKLGSIFKRIPKGAALIILLLLHLTILLLVLLAVLPEEQKLIHLL